MNQPTFAALQGDATPALAARFGDGRDWFFEKRFGLFVHWGLYAISGWHEQVQWRGHVPRAQYVELAKQWNPVQFDPEHWLDLMEEVGMKYICLTTKHHDGFCLWDTAYTAFNTMNTPYGRDIVGQLAAACQRRGVPLCLYYSVVDWNQPNYPNLGRHHELPPQMGDDPNWKKYLQFLTGQVRELCTNYGPLHGFWWDMNVPEAVDRSVNDLIRELQPHAVINNRGLDEGDFGTPERDYETGVDALLAFDRMTEANQSVGTESWGYRRDEDYYSDVHLMRSIAKFLARDANYLLNVGPDPLGNIPAESTAILQRIGCWYQKVREAFEGVVPASHLIANRNVLLTRRGNTFYVVCHREPISQSIKLKPFDTLPRSATLLNSGEPVQCAVDLLPSEHVEARLSLRLRGLPVNAHCDTVWVIKLEFDEFPGASLSATAGGSDLLVR